MKDFLLYTFLVFLVSSLSIQEGKANEIIRMQVKENKAPCIGVAPMECLIVKTRGSKEWTFFYSEIKGFQYEEGFRYTLLVNRKERENVPADASSYTYELVKVIKKRKKKIARQEGNTWKSPVDFLAKYKWKLIQMNGQLQLSSPVYMIFEKDRSRVYGVSGCNRFFGPYQFTGNQIRFEKIAGTLRACSPEIGQLEATFLNILRRDDLHFDIAEQTFNVYAGNELLLMFGLSLL